MTPATKAPPAEGAIGGPISISSTSPAATRRWRWLDHVPVEADISAFDQAGDLGASSPVMTTRRPDRQRSSPGAMRDLKAVWVAPGIDRRDLAVAKASFARTRRSTVRSHRRSMRRRD